MHLRRKYIINISHLKLLSLSLFQIQRACATVHVANRRFRLYVNYERALFVCLYLCVCVCVVLCLCILTHICVSEPNQHQHMELMRLVTASWNRPGMRERKKTSCRGWNRQGKEWEDREEVRTGGNSFLKKADPKYWWENRLDSCFHFVVVLFSVSHVSCTRCFFLLISPLDSVWPKQCDLKHQL